MENRHGASPISTNRKLAAARSGFRMRLRGVLWAFALLYCVWAPALAQVPDRFANAGTTEIEVRQFLDELQAAVARDDRQAVADLFSCPCTVWDGRRSLRLKRTVDVLARYDAVFTADLKNTIAQVRPEDLFSNWQGVMVREGRLWFSPTSTGRLAVAAINAPAGSPPARRP